MKNEGSSKLLNQLIAEIDAFTCPELQGLSDSEDQSDEPADE